MYLWRGNGPQWINRSLKSALVATHQHTKGISPLPFWIWIWKWTWGSREVCMCVRVCLCMCVHSILFVQVGGQIVGVGSLLQSCKSWEQNLGHQPRQFHALSHLPGPHLFNSLAFYSPLLLYISTYCWAFKIQSSLHPVPCYPWIPIWSLEALPHMQTCT